MNNIAGHNVFLTDGQQGLVALMVKRIRKYTATDLKRPTGVCKD